MVMGEWSFSVYTLTHSLSLYLLPLHQGEERVIEAPCGHLAAKINPLQPLIFLMCKPWHIPKMFKLFFLWCEGGKLSTDESLVFSVHFQAIWPMQDSVGLCHCCMLAEMSLTDYCKHSQCCPWVTGWIVKFLNTFLEKAKNILSNGPKWLNYMIMG